MRVPYPAALIAGLFFGSIIVSGTPEPEINGWQKLTVLDPISARKLFSKSDNREARLGEALALFTIEPRIKTNFNEAQQLLTALIDENPDDDYGIAATYYQARLLEAHADEPNRQSAISIYRQLLRDHPGHPVAEFAAPKLAILLLYDDVSPETWEEHYAEMNALRPNLQTTAAQRDTRLVLADALLNLRQDKVRAFPHLKYCDDAGLINRVTRQSVVLIQLAESARALGLKIEAQHYYTRYLQDFSRESASEEIQRRLAALEKEMKL